MTSQFTAPERKAIEAAYRAIEYLCGCTNMGDDKAQLRDALKGERKVQSGDLLAAKAKLCRHWNEGAKGLDMPLRQLADHRLPLLSVTQLGAQQALNRLGSDYTGPLVREAMALCPAASDALHAGSLRRLAKL